MGSKILFFLVGICFLNGIAMPISYDARSAAIGAKRRLFCAETFGDPIPLSLPPKEKIRVSELDILSSNEPPLSQKKEPEKMVPDESLPPEKAKPKQAKGEENPLLSMESLQQRRLLKKISEQEWYLYPGFNLRHYASEDLNLATFIKEMQKIMKDSSVLSRDHAKKLIRQLQAWQKKSETNQNQMVAHFMGSLSTLIKHKRAHACRVLIKKP